MPILPVRNTVFSLRHDYTHVKQAGPMSLLSVESLEPDHKSFEMSACILFYCPLA